MVQANNVRPPVSTEGYNDKNPHTWRRSRYHPILPTEGKQINPDILREKLLENMKKDLLDEVDYSDLQKKYQNEVQKLLTGAGKNPTILHWVVGRLRATEEDPMASAEMEIADMAISLKFSIISETAKYGSRGTALHLAAEDPILFLLLECIYSHMHSNQDRVELKKAISHPNENDETVLHIAVLHKHHHQVHLICDLIDHAEPEAFTKARKSRSSDINANGSKNTLFHDAVHFEDISEPRCRKNPMCMKCVKKQFQWLSRRRTVFTTIEKLVERDREGLTRQNARKQTPYLYNQWSKLVLEQASEAAKAKAPTVTEEGSHHGAPHGVTTILNHNNARTLPSSSKPVGKTKATVSTAGAGAPLVGHPTEASEVRTEVSSCMEKKDEALWSLVESYLNHSAFTFSKFSQTLTCFTGDSDHKSKKGRTLSFKIPDDPLGSEADESFEFLDFAPTMTEVEVRVARPLQGETKTEDEHMTLPNMNSEEWKDNTDSLIRFFDMLRRKSVGRIIKLTVWDNEDMPCNDDTIAKCLHGFDVRYLDWKKRDLSIDVVRLEAPNVVELWLKSRDSSSALRAWGGTDGICCLMQLGKLHVKLERGLEDYDRYIKRAHTFLRDLRDNIAVFRASKILESRIEFLRDNIAIEESRRNLLQMQKQKASENEQRSMETSFRRGSTHTGMVSGDPQPGALERRPTENGRRGEQMDMTLQTRKLEEELAEMDNDPYIKTLNEQLKTYKNKLSLVEREMISLQHERQNAMACAGYSSADHGQGRELENMKTIEDKKRPYEVEPILLTTPPINPHRISATEMIHKLLHLDALVSQSSNDCDERNVTDIRISFITQTLKNLPVLVRVDQDFILSTFLVETTIDLPSEDNSSSDELNYTVSPEGDGSAMNDESPQHIWMDTVRAFAQKYTDDMLKEEKNKITVALIDDGVTVTASRDFKGRISHIGWPEWSAEGPNENFFYSTNGHGTAMAKLIISICPAVRIYVAKLPFPPKDQKSADLSKPKSNISVAKAAADAIFWAVTPPKVDIITMSWTIIQSTLDNSNNDSDIRYLKSAILEAAKHGVIMYCSAADEGAYSSGDLWPKSAGTDALASIGASQKQGHALPKVDVDRIDYLFPGDEIEELTYGSRAGSSAATALAAGFAALIIWCFLKVDKDKERVAKPEKMTTIFNNLKASASWGPFVDATKLFKSDASAKTVTTAQKVVQECEKWV